MTKEELKQEAIKYLENFKDCANCRNRWGDCADQLDEYCLENGCCFATPREQDIYLASAEPREKRIAELEHQLTHRNCVDCSNHSSKLRMRTLELEKENAELKGIKDVATLIRANNDTVVTLMQLNNMLVSKSQQLTKAKELLRWWLSLCGFKVVKLAKDTEQFLNSEVEK